MSLLKLQSPIKKNLTLFDEKDKLVKYSTVNSILKHFFKVRLDFYGKRRDYLIKTLKELISILFAKIKFIQEVIAGTIKVWTKTRQQVLEQIQKKGYPRTTMEASTKKSWDYLLDLRIGTFTKDFVERLQRDLDKKTETLGKLKKTTPAKMWVSDLTKLREFLVQEKSL